MVDNQRDKAILEAFERQFKNRRGSIKQYEELILTLTGNKINEVYANLLAYKIAMLVNYSEEFMKYMSKEEIVSFFISELDDQVLVEIMRVLRLKTLLLTQKKENFTFLLNGMI